jgi:6-pyruvoyl tetrahydropterin synthase-like protein
MFTTGYRFRFYLNARHTMNINDPNCKIHPHTWEISLYIKKTGEGFVQFSQIEHEVGLYLSKYEGGFLNEIPPFDRIAPTMENVGEVFNEQIAEILYDISFLMESLEIGENPTRTFIVTNRTEVYNDRDLRGIREDKQIGQKQDIVENILSKVPVTQYEEPKPDAACEVAVVEEAPQKKSKNTKLLFLILSTAIVIVASIMTILWITRSGIYPWGSDSWYHLFKADFLYKQILAGNLYPLYTDVWYNGIEPLRYWAPLPHYIIAGFEFFTSGNVAWAYNVFMVFIFIFGAFGWILWGKKTGRNKLALVLALLWFFLPDNLRVLFSEGNNSRVVVDNIFPYLLLFVWGYLEKRSILRIIAIFLCMLIITFCHAMISAMVGVTIFIYVLIYGILEKKKVQAIEILIGVLLGVSAAGIWLYPALKGGLVASDAGAVLDLMKGLTYPVIDSLNPVLRLSNGSIFYFGISIFVISLAGTWLGDKKSKAGFIVTLLIFAGTARELVNVLAKIPMSQLFWMMRFTPLAMAAFFSGLLLWKKLRRGVLIIFIILIAIDCFISFTVLCHDSKMPQSIKNTLDTAINISTGRIALLDESEFGSFPNYYISNNDLNKNIGQVFGSGWQGAKTAPNLVWLNTALDKGCYPFLFDRIKELGADTIIIKRDKITDEKDFFQKALEAGYGRIKDTELCSILKLPVNYNFATTAKYEGLCIGGYSSNIALIFPQFEIGKDDTLDDYSENKLLNYKYVYLSGFKYKNKQKAEELVKKLSQEGVKFIIDLTGADSDLYSGRPSFLNVMAQPVDFYNNYPVLNMDNKNLKMAGMPKDNLNWNTLYLENLDNVKGKAEFQKQEMDFLGTKLNNNIVFIGFNLPFFALETEDSQAIGIMERAIGVRAFQTPKRELVKINIRNTSNSVSISSEKGNVVTGVANLDSFIGQSGKYEEEQNLILMDGKELKLKLIYPFFLQGIIISGIGVIGIIVLCVFIRKKNFNLNTTGKVTTKAGESL